MLHDLGETSVSVGKHLVSDTLTDGLAIGKFVDAEDVSAIVGLAGGAKGLVWLSMKKPVALKLVDKLSDAAHTAIDQQVIDTLGEITNILAGRVKLIMQNEFDFQLSLPVVIQGTIAALPSGQKNSITLLSPPLKRISIPFTIFEQEQFTLSVSIQGHL
jgi:CheY-specific phosphatase CheX